MKSLRRMTTADFPEPLSKFVKIDRDGDASFCYAGAYGACQAILDRVGELLTDASQSRGKRRNDVLKELVDYVDRERAEQRQIRSMWDECRAARSREIDEVYPRPGEQMIEATRRAYENQR